jgi:hypothetical protein
MNALADNRNVPYTTGVRAFSLILCLCGFAAAADPQTGPDEATRIKIAEYMIKTPLNEADPSLVSGFMKLDTETLPKKLREKARGKQMAIDAMVKLNEGKKKGPFRDPVPTCNPKYYGPEGVRIMAMMGSEEIEADEEEFIEKKSNCPEAQLMCEFTLNVVVIPRKAKPPIKHYYLMPTDPLMGFLAQKRAGAKAGATTYFEETKPTCKRF